MPACRPEQSFDGAYFGQPPPHQVAACFGWKHARQTFWQERNGDKPQRAAFCLQYSTDSGRPHNRLLNRLAGQSQDDRQAPRSERTPLAVEGNRITSDRQGGAALRCTYQTTMEVPTSGQGLEFRQDLPPISMP